MGLLSKFSAELTAAPAQVGDMSYQGIAVMLVSLIVNGCGWLNLVLQGLVRADTGNVVTKRALLAMRLWANFPFLLLSSRCRLPKRARPTEHCKSREGTAKQSLCSISSSGSAQELSLSPQEDEHLSADLHIGEELELQDAGAFNSTYAIADIDSSRLRKDHTLPRQIDFSNSTRSLG